MRVLAAITACLVLLCAGQAYADGIAVSVNQLNNDSNQRLRLTAALSLAKEKTDPRAVIALAGALRNDNDDTVRKICALALGKMLGPRTAPDALQLAFAALDSAASTDPSAEVLTAAANSLRQVSKFRPIKPSKVKGKGPAVFVNVDSTIDQSKQVPAGGGAKLQQILKENVQRTGYATTWPAGGLPTSTELVSAGSRGFIVASTVKTIAITNQGTQTQIACKVEVRIAPWTGRDGGERWEANRAASASGSAKVTTGNRPRMVSGGITDCLEAVAENVTSQQVIPFLKRLASSGP
jgi:hypothetical protein